MISKECVCVCVCVCMCVCVNGIHGYKFCIHCRFEDVVRCCIPPIHEDSNRTCALVTIHTYMAVYAITTGKNMEIEYMAIQGCSFHITADASLCLQCTCVIS